ncbi:TfoX/Sxy family protein [Clostridium aminobutyricum]|uniref:TfoX/Sxy family protein n=1 Tax=Clostridium aminobutyricum TaxID=33953 RepID=A0A939IGV1_CLOAM|nr:TfoX/Sxy family protein [Clostridium aminobutyricum]MBN7772587.1 TfoX/Sxy family protein [Clostridium aminobutyricum]
MATSVDFMEYVCEQIRGVGAVRYRKMFGEYMVYVNDKPILLVCDNIVYVKQLECIADEMQDADKGYPYEGAKEHYILDIDNADFSRQIIDLLEPVIPIPKPKKKKANKE